MELRRLVRNCALPEQVYAKTEEVQEMMPLSPQFQQKGLELYMSLTPNDAFIMTLDKITRQPGDRSSEYLNPLHLIPTPARGR